MSDRASDGVNILRFARAFQHQTSVSNCVQVGAHRPVIRFDLPLTLFGFDVFETQKLSLK